MRNFEERLVDGRRRQVVVIDRSPSWAESLARLVRAELAVDARWYTPADLVDAELGADVVVLGGCGGLDELRRLATRARAHNPKGKIVVLAADADVRALRQGDDERIEDVLSRDATAGEFVRAVQCLLGGGRIDVASAGRRLDHGSACGRLTHAEARVLQHIAAGLSNEEIATWLGVSTNTVRTHVQRVTGKLGADNRLQAVALARETGMLDRSTVTVVRR